MDVLQTPLGLDIMDVVDNGAAINAFDISATIHCGEYDVQALKVLNKGDYEDYVKGYASVITLVVVVPSGKYTNRIIPFKDNLEVTLSSNALNEVQNSEDLTGTRQNSEERFKATLKNPEDTAIGSRNKVNLSEAMADISDVDVVTFQLVGKAMEKFSLRYCGGIYRKTKVEDFVKTILMAEMSTLGLEAEYSPKGINMVPVLDKTVRETSVIKHGTASKDGVAYIHRHLGGIYSAGVSYFYLNDYWYVFPTYDFTRFKESSKQLVVLRVPDGKFAQIERTYKRHGDVLTVLATGGATHVDTSDADVMRMGNGVRFTNASKLFNDPTVTSGNKTTYSRKDKTTEFTAIKRPGGLNNVKSDGESITTNNLYQASLLASRNGTAISFVWENSDPSLIIPGMQAKFIYFNNAKLVELYGVVIAKESEIVYTGTGLTAGAYTRSTVVHMFVEFPE